MHPAKFASCPVKPAITGILECTTFCTAGLSEAKALIKDIIKRENTVPSFLRLAIHDAFCYDAQNKVFGANASIR